MRHALFRRASIPGWLALLLAFAERLYNLIDAWSNIEFLREKLRGWHLDSILSVLSATPVQLALLVIGLTWIAIVARRRPAATLQAAPALQPASAIGKLEMHRRPKRFAEQIRDMQRQVHDPYGHELLRLLDLLRTEIAGNLRYQPSAAERTYLTAVLEHMRASQTENHDPELTQGLQNLSAAYSAVQSYRPPSQGRGFFRPPTYHDEAKAVLALIEARINPGERATERLPDLSREARELLLEAALDNNGVVMRYSTLAGMYVQTNQRSFVEEGDARSAAQWRGAVDELQDLGLVEDRAGKGEVFHVTAAGYTAADLLRAM